MLAGLFFINVSGQVSFSPVDSKLQTQQSNNLTELICSSLTMTVKFPLKRDVTVLHQNNFATVDSQVIQVIPLTFRGFKKSTNGLSMPEQKQLLDAYSKYELDYFKNELGINVIDPNSQWVVTNSKGWFVWYFKVGNLPVQVDKQTAIQLFASTVIGDKILTVNAPLLPGGHFTIAAQIVNEMMETIIITKQ